MISVIDNTGEERQLMEPAMMARRKVAFRGVFGETANSPSLIPVSDWKPTGLKGIGLPILNQKNIGACNAFATVATMHYGRALAGVQGPTLSAGWLYGRINGGRDNGSMLEDAIAWATKTGVCSNAVVSMLDWRSNPREATTDAANNRVLEWWELPTTEHLASAIQRGFACNIGIMWADGDDTDGDGWLPDRPRGGQGGHAICRVTLEYRGGEWGIGGPNSWGESWGNNGWMTVPVSRLKREEGQFGWFAVREVTLPQGTTPMPAPVE